MCIILYVYDVVYVIVIVTSCVYINSVCTALCKSVS